MGYLKFDLFFNNEFDLLPGTIMSIKECWQLATTHFTNMGLVISSHTIQKWNNLSMMALKFIHVSFLKIPNIDDVPYISNRVVTPFNESQSCTVAPFTNMV